MAITVVRKQLPDGSWNNCMLKTSMESPDENPLSKPVMLLIVTIVDDNLKQIGASLNYDATEIGSEEDWHRKLRKDAAEKQQLITSHSTNPEWNPENYSKNLEDCLKNES